MKKYILSLVFVLITSTNLLNANHSGGKSNLKEIKLNKKVKDLGCLMDAYNGAQKIEASSEAGAYGWDIEIWSKVFKQLFDFCNRGNNVSILVELVIEE